MACENKKTRRLGIIILCLMFCGLPLVAPRNIDCKGKPFHCVNSTHFIICVDLGGGISSTVDDVIIPCPESTICDIKNHFECEFPPPTTLTLPIQPSDVSNESGLGKNKVITKVSWENIDITTTSSVQKISERSEKYLNNASIITIPEELTTTKTKLEAITDGQSTTIHQDNINRQSNNNEMQYQQFPGNSMIDESNNLDVAQSHINKSENTKGTKSNSYTIDIRPTQTNEEFKDSKLSSMGSGIESTSLQNSISSPDITELYSYTPGNRDVVTLDSSFTTNSEILTLDVMSVDTPLLSKSRSKSSKILESNKETTPHGVTTESKKTSTVEPKIITLSYNSSNSSSQINNDNSTAEAILNESNPVNFVNKSINSTIEAITSRKINEYQSSNSSNDMDKISYFNEVSATESFTNITPRVSENYSQSNSTQDHLSSIVSENKYLESEQLNNTMDKYEQKNTTIIIIDITTRPNIPDVQKGSPNQENSDMSVSNPMGILPATDSSIFTTHKQDRVRNQIKKNITKINIHEETTMSDLNTNNYATDSYGVNYDQSTKTFDVMDSHKDGYTTNTFGTDEVTATTSEKNNELKTIVLHNNTETTRANKSNTKFLDNASAILSSHNKPQEDIVWHRTQTKITVPYNHKDNGSSKNQFQSTQTTNSGDEKGIVTTTDSNIDMITSTVSNYNFQQNKEETIKNMPKTHKEGVVKHETQKNITTLVIHGGKAMNDLNNKSYAKDDSSSTNQHQSTQMTNYGDKNVIVTTADSNIDMITTTVPNYNFEQNKEETMNNMSKIREEGVVKHETQKNITTLFIHGGKGTSDLNNESYAKDDGSSKNQFQSTQTNSGNDQVKVTITDSNLDMITMTGPNSNSQKNKEGPTKNMTKTHDDGVVKHETQKNITTLFIHGGKAMSDLSNKSYAKDDGSSKNQLNSSQTTNSGNDQVKLSTIDSNLDMITTTVPNYSFQQNKEETMNNMSKIREEGVVKHETQKNVTTLLIHGGKGMSDLNNESYAKEDSSSKNQYQSIQTTNSRKEKVRVTIADSNIATTIPNYYFEQNKEEITKHMSKTHQEGVAKHETQKNITTLFIQGGKAMSDLNNKSYAKDDSSSKNQYQSTQTTNSGKEKVIVTTADSNIDMITTTVPNYNLEQNNEETTINMSKTHEDGVIKHETQKSITTLFIHGGRGMSDLNNKSYAKDDSSSKNQYQSTQTTNSGDKNVIVSTADSNIDMITTTVPNYNFEQNKEETTKNMSKTHEDGVVKHETQKNSTTLFIHGGKAMSDLSNKSYAKDDSSSKNLHQSTQTTNSGDEKVTVITSDSNIDMIITTLPNYNFQQNKEETMNNMSKTREGVVKHQTQKNVTTLLIHGGKGMSDLNNESYAKDDSSSKNQYQPTQKINSGDKNVIVTTADSNIDMITTTVPNYNFEQNKEETTKNMSKTHEDGVVKHETQKNSTTLFIHGGKAMSDLSNKSYAKDDSSSKKLHQSTQTKNSRDEKVTVITSDSNIDMIITTLPNYNFQQNKEETMNNMSKTREGVVKHETQKNVTTLLIHGGKGMSDLNNESYAKEDSSSKNQYQSTQTTNSGKEKVIVTTADSNIDMITTTVPNYKLEQNNAETTVNMSKTHEDGVVKPETQKNITTLFIQGGKAMSDLSNKSYSKDDSSSKNLHQSTQTKNSRDEKVTVITSDSNIDMIITTLPNYNFQQNKEETMNNMSKTREGVVKHETQKNVTTLFIHGGKGMSDLNNESYVKEDSSSKNQYQSTETTNSGKEKVIVTTADSNIDMITTTVPNYKLEQNNAETTVNMSKTHEDGVVKPETQKNITTLFIYGGKAMSNLSNKIYAKDDGSSKNQFHSTQSINSGNNQVEVTNTDSNLEMITTVPNYNFQRNKEETMNDMSKIREEDVIKHETQKNITTLFIHGGKGMRDLKNKSYAKADNSTQNPFQSIKTTNSGNDENKVNTPDSNIDMITTPVPNYKSEKNKDETSKTISKTHEEGVVRHETQKNITTLFIHGGNAMSELNNKSYAKADSSRKNQFQSTQTTNSGDVEFIVTTADSNITTSSFDGEKATSDLNNKSYAKDNDSKILYQSTQKSNQYKFRKNSVLKKELPFNNSKNSFEADKIVAMEHNTTITTELPDFIFTKVDDSGLKTNLNNYTDTFVSTYNSNTHFTKSNIDTDRFNITDQLTTITERNISDDEMTPTQITNDMAFKPKSAPINESKISSETKSSTPISTVKGTKTSGDGKLEKNDKLLSNIGQEISLRTNRQAANQMDKYNITTTTIIVSEIPPNSPQRYGEDLTAKRVPNYPDVKISTTISEDFNSYTLQEIGITEKYTIFSDIDAKNLTTVAEDFLTAVSTASYNITKKISTTSISKESMSGITFVNNGRETTLSSSTIINTNIPQYDETKVVESKSLQTSLWHSLNIEADTTTPSSESDKVTSVLNRALNTRDVTLLKKKSHTQNYQVAESPALSSINLTSLAVSPSYNKILHTSVTNTLVDTESATDTSTNQPQQLNETKKLFNYFYNTDAEVNENKPNKGVIKSIQSRDITESKASTTSEALRLKEKIRNESILNNNQQSDIIPSELSIKVGSNTGLHAFIDKNIGKKISKPFKDIKQNSSTFLSQTTHTHYASSTISSLEKSDRSITTAKMKIINTASTIRKTNDMSGAPLVTQSTINKRKKKTKTNDIAKDTLLLENLHESDGNISLLTSNKYKDLSNNSNSNMTIDSDRQADSKSKKLNKNLEITSERTNFFLINGQKPYKEMSVNSTYRNVSNDTERVSSYYTNSTTRGSIKTTTKNTTTMAKRIRDVNSKSTNTDPTNVVVVLFDYGRQIQKKGGKSVTKDTNFEENPDDNIHVDSSSHNRYENSDPNDIRVEPMTKANNADNDNDPQSSSTPKVDGRINDTDMVLCGRYTRGRYPDKTDCRKFYICVGRNPPIRGTCPNNTVYSESRKQCTKNLSHCVRNNNFKCLTEGRFSDFLKDDIYHICIKNKLGDFVLYKFQCQNGFRLDKKTVKCIKEIENSSSSVSSASENSKSNNKNTTEKTLKIIDKFECQEEGKFADTRDCRTYYVCSKKRNVYRRKKKKCESDERFDRDKKKCVDAESYECDI